MKRNIRELALSVMLEWEAQDKYVNLALDAHYLDPLSSSERGMLTALVYTAVEHKLTYDYMISALAGRELSRLDPHTVNILRLGMCQIIHMTSIPDFAAVNETVKLARSSGERSIVNGILRRAAREKDRLPYPDEKKNYRRYLSVKYSFPQGIVKHFDSLLGREDTERLLDFYNSVNYTDITVNTTKISVEDYASLLADSGYEAVRNIDTGMHIRINKSLNPENLPGFSEGYFFVQDRASLIAVDALAPTENDIVVDCCACPGGKSFAAAVLMKDRGEIHSLDLHESKLSLIAGGACRLGLDSIIPDCHDARAPRNDLVGRADKVICDVPCSGLGVLGKKPDLRYNAESAMDALPTLQLSILTASAKYLRAGGEMIYSTCTVNPEENEGVLASFLAENPDFASVDFAVGNLKSNDGMLQLLPHVHGTDGFFISKLTRLR